MSKVSTEENHRFPGLKWGFIPLPLRLMEVQLERQAQDAATEFVRGFDLPGGTTLGKWTLSLEVQRTQAECPSCPVADGTSTSLPCMSKTAF